MYIAYCLSCGLSLTREKKLLETQTDRINMLTFDPVPFQLGVTYCRWETDTHIHKKICTQSHTVLLLHSFTHRYGYGIVGFNVPIDTL